MTLDRDVSGGNERIAHYPVDKLPGVEEKSAVPVDRKQALLDQAEAERALVDAKEKAGV